MDWARRRCQEAKEAKKIDVNLDLLRYEGGPEGAVAMSPVRRRGFEKNTSRLTQ